jgi:hypothetical protein
MRAFLLSLALAATALAAEFPDLPKLKVHENHRYLSTQDGKPFFYLGDTAWELFHRMNKEDATRYFTARQKQGFTVVEAVALAEFSGLTEPNRFGHLPLKDNDPTKPNEDYFADVDWFVAEAARHGLYTGLLPTWGDKVNKKWGQGPEIFTVENARQYGLWLGKRYKDAPVIWILGGDRPTDKPLHLEIFRALAEGLRAGDGGAHLCTYHPMGARSSREYVNGEAWLDFHQIQSGHGQRNARSYDMLAKDLAAQPPRPVMDGEPNYEDHPVRGDKTHTQWFGEWDVRKLCYWDLFAGAHGHTYGAHPIWQFWDGKTKPCADPRHSWMEALELPGSTQVGYARRLLEARPFFTRIPAQDLLASAPGEGADHVQATRDREGTYAFIYTASGKPFTVKLQELTAKKLHATWWDPRTGQPGAGEAIENSGAPREFTPPTQGEGKDWVLVLDDESKGYKFPTR